jgi:hypothetical protein
VVPDQGVIVLDPDKPATVRFTTLGGAGGVEYALAREVKGLEIDKTGLLTIHPDAFTTAAIDAIISGSQEAHINPMTGEIVRAVDLAAYQKTAGATFKALTGRDPRGVPVALSLRVSARDKDLQAATADRVVLMEIPVEAVDAKVKAGQRPGTPETMPTSMGRGPSAAPDPSARIDALEKRIDALEAKIDLLTKMLGEKNK